MGVLYIDTVYGGVHNACKYKKFHIGNLPYEIGTVAAKGRLLEEPGRELVTLDLMH